MNDQATIAALCSPLLSNHDAVGAHNVPMPDDRFHLGPDLDRDTMVDLHRMFDDGCPIHHE